MPADEKTRVVIISKLDEISDTLGYLNKQFAGELTCRLQDIAPALIHAKHKNLRLQISEDAPPFEEELPMGEDLMVLESHGDLPDVIAANYIFACNGTLVLIPAYDDDFIDRIGDDLCDIDVSFQREEEMSIGMQIVEELIRKTSALDPETLEKFRTATFITEGVPYNVSHRSIPCCHLVREPDLGRFLFNAIWMEHEKWSLGSAIIFSPFSKELPLNETVYVSDVVTRGLTYIYEPLFDDDATGDTFRNFIEYYPYDILHICSHGGGGGEGYETTLQFNDKEGKPHTVEVYEVIDKDPNRAKPDENKKIRVGRKFYFRTFDGIPWHEHKEKSKFLGKDLRNLETKLFPQKAVKSRVAVPYVPRSNRLITRDGCFFGFIQNTEFHPIVFNNSCSSVSELGPNFLFAGARCYIGTCWPVRHEVATLVACEFYTRAPKETLLEAFWGAVQMHTEEENILDSRNYMFFGTHFSTLCQPPEPSLFNILQYFPARLSTWISRYNAPHYPKSWKKSFKEIIDFLTQRMDVLEERIEEGWKISERIMPIVRIAVRARMKAARDGKLQEIDTNHRKIVMQELVNAIT